MAQHFVDMDMHKHNPSILSTDAINACVGICTFYNDGVFLLHASTAFGIPATLTTTKEDVQRFLQNVAAAFYETVVDTGRLRAVCIIGGKIDQSYKNLNRFIKELKNERKNIKIIDNPTEGTIAHVKFQLTDKHLEEFLGAIIYSNTQANIVEDTKFDEDEDDEKKENPNSSDIIFTDQGTQFVMIQFIHLQNIPHPAFVWSLAIDVKNPNNPQYVLGIVDQKYKISHAIVDEAQGWPKAANIGGCPGFL